MKELLIASAAFALFILCRRMAGMTKVISDASDANLVKVVVVGKVVALPLIIGMALISSDTGSLPLWRYAWLPISQRHLQCAR